MQSLYQLLWTRLRRWLKRRRQTARSLDLCHRQHRLQVPVADTFVRRLTGLLPATQQELSQGLFIPDCHCVHSLGMRSALDVVFLDEQGFIRRIKRLEPFCFVWCPAARHVLELDAGRAAAAGLCVGQRWVPDQGCSRGQSGGHPAAGRIDAVGTGGEQGASLVEFLIAVPLLLVTGTGIVQTGLLYEARTLLNHATFEAARVGAVQHALPAPMHRELNHWLAGGDGPDTRVPPGAAVRAGSSQPSADGTALRLTLLNPSPASFDDWAVPDAATGGRVIPNAHLQHHDPHDRGPHSGQNLQEANLLEIEVVHGYRPIVPLAGRLFLQALALLDPAHEHFYASGLIPLRSTARVRMQSDTWEQSLSVAGRPDAATGNGAAEISIPPGFVHADNCIDRHGLGAPLAVQHLAALLGSDCGGGTAGASAAPAPAGAICIRRPVQRSMPRTSAW